MFPILLRAQRSLSKKRGRDTPWCVLDPSDAGGVIREAVRATLPFPDASLTNEG
jgi:hypothetical protein